MKERFKQWSDDFFTGKQIKLSKADGGIYFKLSFMEKMNQEIPINSDDEDTPFLIRVAKKRSEYANLDISNNAIIMLSILCDRPGSCVMYVYALKAKQLKDNKKITMTELSYTFPMGFYNEDHLHKMWDNQKVKGDQYRTDNMLDLPLDQLW